MADYAVQITKTTPFQGGGEEFSNVWTISTDLGETMDDVATINQLVAFEKKIHTSNVTFLRASSYGIGGTDAGNVMREIQDLSGTGGGAFNFVYRECAIMVEFELPRSLILRRRRIARKWFHTGGVPTAMGTSAEMLQGAAPFPATAQTWFRQQWTESGLDTTLAGGGRLASAGDNWGLPILHPFLEHRQFRRGGKRRRSLLP